MRFNQGQLVAQRYQVISLIGKGSGGEVYKVWDRNRSTYLALKLLKPEWNDNPELLTSFLEEARSLSQLQHPNIVRFYELVSEDGLTFFLMDFVDGITLRSVLRTAQNPLTLEKTLEIITPICRALHYAHQNKIFHRDIKPENILIDRNGIVYLTDFGIAFQKGNESKSLLSAGTPAYCSPEQVLGAFVGPQTDVYSLGIVLYELLTLKKPFQGTSRPDCNSKTECIRWEQVNLNPIAPMMINPSLSQKANDVILKCLRKDLQKRYQGTLELLAAVEMLQLNGIATKKSEPPENSIQIESIPIKKPREKVILQVLVVMAVVLLSVIFLALGKPSQKFSVTADGPNLENQFQQTCMTIDLSQLGDGVLEECITNVSKTDNGSLLINFKWKLVSGSKDFAINIQADSDNYNMYIMDNLGNRLDHISTGGGTNRDVILKAGENKEGWFLFPAVSPEAEGFYFVDDDNQVRTETLEIP